MRRKILEDLFFVVWGALIVATPVGISMQREAQLEQITKDAAVDIPVEVRVTTFAIEPKEVTKVKEPPYVKLEGIPLIVQDNAYSIGQTYGISQELLEAMAFREATYREDAISEDGRCIGIMQVNPVCHQDRMERLGITREELTQIDCNMYVAADYLCELFEEYDDVGAVLMLYNGDSRAEAYMEGKCEMSSYAKDILDMALELEEAREKCYQKSN